MARSMAAIIRSANKALLAEGRLDAVETNFTEDYVAHVTDRDLEGGHAGIQRFLTTLRGAFADLEVEVEILVEGRSRVAWQRTVTGKHRRSFQGFPATNRKLVWRDMLTSRFRGGRIAEEWAVSDLAERLLRARKRRA